MTLPRALLGLIALGFTGFGLAFILYPHQLAAPVGISLPSGTARADFMATYGGLELGVGAFLAYCAARPERVRLGLIAAGCTLSGFAVARVLGILIAASVAPLIHVYLAIEIAAAALAFWAARRATRAQHGG